MPRSATTLTHEENVERAPFAPPAWLAYLTHLRADHAAPTTLFPIYERAVAALPGSYKLWHAYAAAFDAFAATHHPRHPARDAALAVSRRAAAALPRSPVVRALLIARLCRAARWTAARHAVNAALRALPVTQHDHVWKAVVDHFLPHPRAPPRSCVLLLHRYAKHTPGAARETLFGFLYDAKLYRQAVLHLADVLADPAFHPVNSTRHQLWIRLAKTAAAHVDTVALDIPARIRSALREEGVQVGELWVALATYFTRKALFEYAADVYEEALSSISAVRDFALVFDAYAKFLEALVTAELEDNPDGDLLELRMARLEHLTDRRPMLLSDVVLRQNPHNVHEWHKRARMYKSANHPANVVDTYTKSLQTVNPWQASNGRPHTLWLAFARYYEDASDYKSARRVLDKAVENPDAFRNAEDLAAVWCEYAEMDLRRSSPEEARNVLLRAVTKPDKIRLDEARTRRGGTNSNAAALAVVGAGAGDAIVTHKYDKSSPAWNAYKSRRLWHFLIDLTHSIASPDDVIKLHQQMLELRIATPQTILSGAAYLESQRLFEQAFRLYDKGASAIPWPDALQIWVVYLTKFVNRFKARKLERARNLFEEAIRAAPSTKRAGVIFPHPQLRLLFVMYADMEEEHSLARHALNIFARAVKEVRDDDRPDLYRLYIIKLATMFGVTKTRPVYEEALSSLTRPEDVLDFAVRFTDMETRLGEIDRARAILKQTCHIADPRRRGIFEIFWTSWREFELSHGSEDTFRDMLREKRGVQLRHKGMIVDMDMLYRAEGQEDDGAPADKDTLQSQQEHGDSVGDGAEETGIEGVKQTAVPQEDVTNVESKPKADQDVNDEEIALDLSDNDDEGDDTNGQSKHQDAGDMEQGQPRDSGGIVNVVQKELPLALRKLVAAAHEAESLKRKRESEKDATDDEGTQAKEETKSISALERFKRRR